MELLGDDKEPKIVIGVLDALTQLKAKDGVQAACKLLTEDIVWEVKISACEYLAKLNDNSLIEPLIQALLGEKVEGRVRTEVVNVLKQLTGQDLGVQGAVWMEWWKKKQAGEEYNPKDTKDAKDEGTRAVTAVCYGVKVSSTRIVFIMDISGSMDWGATWKEDKEAEEEAKKLKPRFTDEKGKPADDQLVNQLKAKKEQVDKRPVAKRIHAVKRELINTIYNLDPSVNFTIIFFSTKTQIWKETLVPATAQNKKDAIEEVEKQVPTASTSTMDALDLAFHIAEKAGFNKKEPPKLDTKSNYLDMKGGADTIFIVTDGIPNTGRIGDRTAIIEEIKKMNETRKIKINTVGIGSNTGIPPGTSSKEAVPDPDFLRRLAEATGGIFVNRIE
jgi:hypothetical protein